MDILGLFDDIDLNKNKKKSINDLLALIKAKEATESDIKTVLKSNKISIDERISIIHERVLKVLGKQKKNIVVISDKTEFHNYILEACKVGVLAVDTETNNSLDPITCKIIGLCLHYPGGKQAYIPINHRDPHTKKRLDWQLTEKDIADEFNFLAELRSKWQPEFTAPSQVETQQYLEYWIEHKLKRNEDVPCPLIVMANGKFDREVIYCTCGVLVPVDYDTQLAARLIDENDLAGLKYLYTKFIDKTQSKYNLEGLYLNTFYADSDPNIFALYAATDALMTNKVCEFQLKTLLAEGNERLFKLFTRVEMNILLATAAQELVGIKVDEVYGKMLKKKYTRLVEQLDEKVEVEMAQYKPLIDQWRLTPEANEKTIVYVPKKTKLSLSDIKKKYPNVDEEGNRFKYGATKSEQLNWPIPLSSPVQLSILLYDVLKMPVVDKENPRGTGGDILEEMNEQRPTKLIGYILERRGYMKLISTYIDTIPILCKHWPDGRIRFHLNQLGTDTGRFSSGGDIAYVDNYGTDEEERVEVPGINIQNIPSGSTNIRTLFVGETTYGEKDFTDNFEINEYEELETNNGYKYCKDLTQDDLLVTDEGLFKIKEISYSEQNKTYSISI